MKILFLHGWNSVPGGVKPRYLAEHGHEILNPALNVQAGNTPLVLLCPAWKRWGTARKVRPQTVILHSRADDVIPFADSLELVETSGLPKTALIEIGTDHRLAEPEPLSAMLAACERLAGSTA
jgi:hypothetical protein